jgi:hypothetical protein
MTQRVLNDPTQSITLPTLSEPDPVVGAEGSLDPLGLASTAERIADSIAPGIRNRMRRIRFVTLSAIGALLAEGLSNDVSDDAGVLPSLAWEWVVLESFARRWNFIKDDADGIPGSQKARAVIARGERLGPRNYLKSPRVFGFTGVVMPVNESFGILNTDRSLGPNGLELIRAWEDSVPDPVVKGFLDGFGDGTRFRNSLSGAVRASMHEGECSLNPSSHLFGHITSVMLPSSVSQGEKDVLEKMLLDETKPLRAETFRVLRDLPVRESEKQTILEILETEISESLAVRLQAVVAFENFAEQLLLAFQTLLYHGTYKQLAVDELNDDMVLGSVAREIGGAFNYALTCISKVDEQVAITFDNRFSHFQRKFSVSTLSDSVLAHHTTIQHHKLPNGKRVWIEDAGTGLRTRHLYRLDELPTKNLGFVHPYRIAPLQSFVRDLDR